MRRNVSWLLGSKSRTVDYAFAARLGMHLAMASPFSRIYIYISKTLLLPLRTVRRANYGTLIVHDHDSLHRLVRLYAIDCFFYVSHFNN